MEKRSANNVTFSHIIFCLNRAIFYTFNRKKLLSMTHHRNTDRPDNTAFALTLIGEELKSRRFFNTLHELGLEYSFFQPHLDHPILQTVGLDPSNDDVFDFYSDLMDKHSKLISAESKSVSAQAKEVYDTLLRKKQSQ